jgi:hypothetical protein
MKGLRHERLDDGRPNGLCGEDVTALVMEVALKSIVDLSHEPHIVAIARAGLGLPPPETRMPSKPGDAMKIEWSWPRWLKANWIAMDGDGEWWGFEKKPIQSETRHAWRIDPDDVGPALELTKMIDRLNKDPLLGFDAPPLLDDWRRSLIQNPHSRNAEIEEEKQRDCLHRDMRRALVCPDCGITARELMSQQRNQKLR